MIKCIPVNDQIQLTDIRETDKLQFVQFLNDMEVFRNTLMIPYPYNASNAEWFINDCREKEEQYGEIISWAIRNKEGLLIGGIGRMMKSDMGSQHKDEIGYWIGKPYRGQGIMTQVVKAYCDYLFEKSRIVRIEAVVFPQNVASMKVLEKAGFEKEAYCKKYHIKQGKAIDGVMFVNIR